MGGMTDADFQGGLICSALARFVPPRHRLLVFAGGALIGLGLAVFAVLGLLTAKDAPARVGWAAILGFACCAGLTHASIAYGFYTRNSNVLILADVLMVAAVVMAMLSATLTTVFE